MKQTLHNFIRELKLKVGFLVESYHFWKLTCRYNASSKTDDDIQKMQYTLSRETHTIEKGLSMRNPRRGFGQQKVSALIQRLNKYYSLYSSQDNNFMDYPLGAIKNYIEFTKETGVAIPDIEQSFNDLVHASGRKVDEISTIGGVFIEKKENIIVKCNKDFESLLYSRHSMRYFSDEPVNEDIIIKALKLAQRTPSACNRQGWITHVFREQKSVELAKWQGGCKGFEEEIKCAILVTANLKAFLRHEVHQAYIDGGLYAMNLINALHSLGLGTIPLSCGFEYRKLSKLNRFGIEQNEVPILIIGTGNLMTEMKVAVSERKTINKTNIFH